MKITIEPTDKIVKFGIPGINHRMWRGRTENGGECILFVYRIVTTDLETETQIQSANKLAEALPPGRIISIAELVSWGRWEQ